MSGIATLFVGLWLLVFGWALGYLSGREQKKEAERRGWTVLETLSNGHNRPACRLIGAALEITMEGGEDVGEYVEWACKEAYIEERKADLAFRMAKLNYEKAKAVPK